MYILFTSLPFYRVFEKYFYANYQFITQSKPSLKSPTKGFNIFLMFLKHGLHEFLKQRKQYQCPILKIFTASLIEH